MCKIYLFDKSRYIFIYYFCFTDVLYKEEMNS